MNDEVHLREEIRAAQEEKVRKERQGEALGRGGVTPPRKPAFQRLRTLSVEELTAHIKRLERDIDHLETDAEAWAKEADSNAESSQE